MSFTNMDSKEANVESAPAYSGVIPQTQYESMGGPLRREAEEKEDELSQRNKMKPVKRNPEQTATKLQPNKKSKRRKHKKEKEKSQDGSGSFTVSDPPSRTSKRHSKKTQTKQEPSCFLGLIRFEGFNETDATSKYLRCAPDTKADTIWDIMIKKWHMERPQLIISVYSDTDQNLTNTFHEKFRWFLKGLYTWIITNEIYASKYQWFAPECKNDVMVIGVAPWGCVANRQALEGEENQTHCLLPKEYSKIDALRSKQKHKNVILNESYSHFILIDDGTENTFGGEIDFRTSLEKFILEQSVNPDDKESSQTIPVISFIAGGDINTIKMVSQSVTNGIPVMIIKGGAVADFIHTGMLMINTDLDPNSDMSDKDVLSMEEEISSPKYFDKSMKEYAENYWGRRNTKYVMDDLIMNLRQALQHKKLLNIWDSICMDDIDAYISSIQFKDGRSKTKIRLILALAWNNYDLSETLLGLEITNSEKKKKQLTAVTRKGL